MRSLLTLFFLLSTTLPAADLALLGGTVYPSPGSAPIPNAAILVHNGKITAVGPRQAARIAAGTQTIDCTGNFIVAGFWNSHIHVLLPTLLDAAHAPAAGLNTQLEEMLNRWGFTTVFDISSVLDNTLALRRRIDNGELRGPRILTVGEPLWTAPPVYVRDFLVANHIDIQPVASPSEAAQRVRAEAQRGADGVKLFTGSAQALGKVANMPLEMVRAAVEEAHLHKLPVFAHPQNSAGVEAALSGGVDILAHTVPNSPPWTAAFVDRLRRAHMALIPTLTLFDSEARKGKMSDSDREAFVERMVAELRVFALSGGEVLFGTDVGYIDRFDTALEFTLMSRSGMSFEQILAALTTAPAARFGFAAKSGRLAPGMDADLVVLRQDPAADVTAFSKVQLTLRHGDRTYAAR